MVRRYCLRGLSAALVVLALGVGAHVCVPGSAASVSSRPAICMAVAARPFCDTGRSDVGVLSPASRVPHNSQDVIPVARSVVALHRHSLGGALSRDGRTLTACNAEPVLRI